MFPGATCPSASTSAALTVITLKLRAGLGYGKFLADFLIAISEYSGVLFGFFYFAQVLQYPAVLAGLYSKFLIEIGGFSGFGIVNIDFPVQLQRLAAIHQSLRPLGAEDGILRQHIGGTERQGAVAAYSVVSNCAADVGNICIFTVPCRGNVSAVNCDGSTIACRVLLISICTADPGTRISSGSCDGSAVDNDFSATGITKGRATPPIFYGRPPVRPVRPVAI